MAKTKWNPTFQFSLRAMLWSMAVLSMLIVAIRDNTFFAAAIAMLVGGGALILNDCLSETDARLGASQLLVGAVVLAMACGMMFAAAYVQWVTDHSGTLDYVTFAMALFALCYGIWVRSTNATRLRLTSQLGYFAFIAGAFMLNHVLFDTVIRHLR